MSLFNIQDFRKFSDVYIETGSAWGESIKRANGFKVIKSVEIHEPFYNHCKSKYDVELYLGNSIDKLPLMLGDVDRSAVILLDAHPAGPGTGGHDDLMTKGEHSEFQQESIISRELEAILKHRKDHVIIIDDMNGLNPFSEILEHYSFRFYDEDMGIYYKDKFLVCFPILAR